MRIIAGRVHDFPPGSRTIVAAGRRSIGVFRVGDRFYALNNHCPHQGGPLCLGRVSPWAVSSAPGEVGVVDGTPLLACPWHGWEYDLATGQSFLGPGAPPARSYEVSVRSGRELTAEGPGTTEDAAGTAVRTATGGPPGRIPGPYQAETFDVAVEDDYVVVDTTPRSGP